MTPSHGCELGHAAACVSIVVHVRMYIVAINNNNYYYYCMVANVSGCCFLWKVTESPQN